MANPMQDLRIIYYHHIQPEPAGNSSAVSLNKFKWQIAFLRRKYEIISLSQAIQLNQEGQSLKGKMCITFDDGFVSFYQHALPVLKQYHLPATVFLISSCVNNQQLMWRNKLDLISKQRSQHLQNAILSLCENYHLELPQNNLMQWSLNWPMAQKDDFCTFLWEYTRMPDIHQYLSDHPVYMNTDQIHDAMNQNIEFGSHTRSHPVCSKLTDVELSEEVEGSLSELSILLNQPIALFSYPFGLRAAPELETCLINNQKVKSLLGIYYKKKHPNDPFHWERDNMEIPFVKSMLRFTPLLSLYLKK